ncbi:GNAT family N-acetyltransferase [Propionivibrio sp.]|uniref:GNAT family N-acetyltransferase n=1 Tax=Propionivibrio sp. TaxID=2212460 RepID=UPI0039E5D953
MNEVHIGQAGPREALALLPGLIALIEDAVAGGASVGFLHPVRLAEAEAYWFERIREIDCGCRVLLLARAGERLVGTVQLRLETQPNGTHRAEIQRLLVLREERLQGIGHRLVAEAERAAMRLGRWLLTLNTRSGDLPEQFYLRRGYVPVGRIPEFARNPDGSFNTTTILYRQLATSVPA